MNAMTDFPRISSAVTAVPHVPRKRAVAAARPDPAAVWGRLFLIGLPVVLLLMAALSGGAAAGDCAGTPLTVAEIELPTIA